MRLSQIAVAASYRGDNGVMLSQGAIDRVRFRETSPHTCPNGLARETFNETSEVSVAGQRNDFAVKASVVFHQSGDVRTGIYRP